MLLAAAVIVLLIACTNVANLWLARASVQKRDAAVRAALGASRGRLMQLFLIESCVVSIASSLVGLGLAWQALACSGPPCPRPRAVTTIGIDVRVLDCRGCSVACNGTRVGRRSGSSRIKTGAFNRAEREQSRRRNRPRTATCPRRAGRRRSRHGRRAAGRRGAVHRQLRQRDASQPWLQQRLAADRAIFPRTNPGSAPPDLRPAFEEIVARAKQLPGVLDAAAPHRGFRCASTCGSTRCGRQASRPTPT